jgi:hypothetical protein
MEEKMRKYAPLASNSQIKFALKFMKAEMENAVSLYMKALGDEKLSEEAWKRLADVNRDLLK